jgi:Uma2 family endonuclease
LCARYRSSELEATDLSEREVKPRRLALQPARPPTIHEKVFPSRPTAVFEVLSDSTAAFDAGEKFTHYRRIPELREYVLVSHRERRIELRSREARGALGSLRA